MTDSIINPSEAVLRQQLDEQGILTVTIDMQGRSQNVLNEVFSGPLNELIDRVATDAAVKGVIFVSGKKDFIAGGDIDEMFQMKTAEDAFKAARKFHLQSRRLEMLGKPIVAAVNGTALGGGLEFVLACHHRIAVNQPKAKYGLPEVKLGLLPGGGGTQRLPRLIGLKDALPLMLEGKDFNAEKAFKLGIFQALATDADDLLAQARAWILANPTAQQPWDAKGYKFPGGNAQTPANAQNVVGLPGMLKNKTHSNFPAPLNIASAVVEGSLVDIDTALKIEARYFADLVTHQVTKNILAATWFQLNALNKGGSRPAGFEKTTVKKLGILGAGMMGAGIAYAAAKVGIQVVLKDVSLAAAEQGKAYSAKLLDGAIAKGRSTPEQKAALLGRILATDQSADLAGCDYVVEAVFEDRALKAQVTQETEAVMAADGVFGSNTSTLPITGLAQASVRPAQFIGIHFFSPVDKMPLVEIIVGKQTSPQTLARTFDFVQQLRKTPIVVNDARGFYTTRCFGTYVREGMALLAEGQPPAMIENVGVAAGMPVGPLALSDEVSLSLMQHAATQTRKDLEAEGQTYTAEAPDAVVDRMMGLERAGKKAGRGFYDYPQDGKKRLWAGLAEQFPLVANPMSREDMRDRLMFVQALETVRCMEEGVVTQVADANIGSLFGWGFAPHLGGTLQSINAYGVERFVARAQALAAQYGPRFAPPKLLQQMAQENRTF